MSFSAILNWKPLTISFLIPCSRSSTKFSKIPYSRELFLSSHGRCVFLGKVVGDTISVTNWFWLEGVKLYSDTAKDF